MWVFLETLFFFAGEFFVVFFGVCVFSKVSLGAFSFFLGLGEEIVAFEMMKSSALLRIKRDIAIAFCSCDCSFAEYMWEFVNNRPQQNRFKNLRQLPSSTAESEAFSKDLKKRGFKYNPSLDSKLIVEQAHLEKGNARYRGVLKV